MQLAGKPFTEPTLFRAAHAYETAMPWRSKRPALAGGGALASAAAG
jgi:Asp-tRNA(Asn)/Glu-tRNA(Gln) amidotransferase A subunit family amidase